MFSDKKIAEIRDYLKTVSKESRIYIGCDSTAKKKMDGSRWATYTCVFIVHKDNSKGCKVFFDSVTERDFSPSKKRPSYRLMMEVSKTVEFYTKMYDILQDRDVEVHLDISPNKKNFSSTIVQEAIGYVYGATGIEPKIKPDSWASSHCADHAVRGKLRSTTTLTDGVAV